MGQQYEFKSVVAETLLIPLYMRAKESRRGSGAILKDDWAERLVNVISYDYSKFDNAPLSEVGCVVRGWYFDNAVKRFIESKACPVVVNAGCGLDTRYQRIGDYGGRAVFYELDLPEVISLRRSLIPETANDRYIAASLLDVDWLDRLLLSHPGGDFIFVFEGVLMYFYEMQVRQVLHSIASRFGSGEIWFDVCGTMMSRHGVKPDSMHDSKAQIRSGISDGHIVERWEPQLLLIEQANYMKFYRWRWGFFFGQVLGRMPRLCYKFSSLLGYRIIQR